MRIRDPRSAIRTTSCRTVTRSGNHPGAISLEMAPAPEFNSRFSGLLRNSEFGIRNHILLLVLSATPIFRAATNETTDPDAIPPLRPPKPEIPPGFWEQHGLVVMLLGVAAILVAVLLWRMWPRPKPAEIPGPAAIAREALEPLRHRPEDAALLAETSLILRRYFVAAFDLPRMEFTNSELCGHLEKEVKADPELSKAATDLLKGMEHLRFDAEANPAVTRVVEQALELIHRAEVQSNRPPAQGDVTALRA